MPIIRDNKEAVHECPGIFRDLTTGEYHFPVKDGFVVGWSRGFEGATEAIISRMKRDMLPPDTLANTKPFTQIRPELMGIFDLEEDPCA